MLRQTPNRRHRWLAPASSDLESSYESRPGYHTVEVHTQAGPTQVSLHNHAVEALAEQLSHPPSAFREWLVASRLFALAGAPFRRSRWAFVLCAVRSRLPCAFRRFVS